MRLLLLLLVCSFSMVRSSRLVVCVREAVGLADRDTPIIDSNKLKDTGVLLPAWVARSDMGSDPFVSVFVDGDEVRTTGLASKNDKTPVWNECFDFDGDDYDHATSVAFVVADSDLHGSDDKIGVGCTSAGTGARWIELVSSTGRRTGTLRIQIFHLRTDDDADATMNEALGLTTVVSEMSQRPTAIERGVARVSCPSGSEPVGCLCWSNGLPGCAYARIEGSDCLSFSSPHVEMIELGICKYDEEGNQLEPGKPCTPPSFHQPPPSGVIATARCAKSGLFSSLVNRESEPSMGSMGDAVAARCGAGQTMLGCAISRGGGNELLLYSYLAPSPGAPPSLPLQPIADADATPACVAIGGTGGEPTVASARCGTPLATEGIATLSLARAQAFGSVNPNQHFAVARCPRPFVAVGCTCFADYRNCMGSQFSVASDGTATCNVSTTKALMWMSGRSFIYVNCIWRGSSGRVIAPNPSANDAKCDAAASRAAEDKWGSEVGGKGFFDKPYLAPGYAERVSQHTAEQQNGGGGWAAPGQRSGSREGATALFAACWFGAGAGASALVCAWLQRRRREAGEPLEGAMPMW
jgi:hypothetical protein